MKNTPLTQTSHAETVQTYKFEFGDDDKIYSISFKGLIPRQEIRNILEFVRNSLFKKCGDAIQSYLDSNYLFYSNFSVLEKTVKDGRTMEFTKMLLQHPSCKVIDEWIKNANVYFGVMDYLKWMEGCSAGSYCVVAKFPSAQDGQYKYHAICQTFKHATFTHKEWSHFAIRKDDGEHNLITLDEDKSCPVLATFGCVDLISLLINITDIKNKQQAADFANK